MVKRSFRVWTTSSNPPLVKVEPFDPKDAREKTLNAVGALNFLFPKLPVQLEEKVQPVVLSLPTPRPQCVYCSLRRLACVGWVGVCVCVPVVHQRFGLSSLGSGVGASSSGLGCGLGFDCEFHLHSPCCKESASSLAHLATSAMCYEGHWPGELQSSLCKRV